ncbi:hypothetical protein F2Q70_00038144 [Brassica cretica]|uniref:Plus3 domain-containing protein n=1 Tax=Brassica cretica TaxID=69181 RepID=A0A8S9K5Y8_BRACR|nr:hypothetical protein F2Q70_00038144 [Brassica cretica]KAF2616418.1 hypothetical protein F2Q68_00038576 [Brassica cretica]
MEFQRFEEMLEYDVNVKEAIISEEVNQVMQTVYFPTAADQRSVSRSELRKKSFEEDQLLLAYNGILPSIGASFVSVLVVEDLLGKGEDVYSIILIIRKREDDKDQNTVNNQITREFEVMLKELEELLLSRSKLFNILVQPGFTAIA